MKKYEVLPHTADLQIRVFGKTKKELFENALFAMGECQQPEFGDGELIEREIEINSPDQEALLVDFLNEALYLSQINKESYFGAELEQFSDYHLKGKILGKKIVRFGEDIKGVTFHDLKISRGKDGRWKTAIVFDI